MSPVVNFLKNKYFLVFLFAGVWIVFLDTYNLRARYRVSQQIEQLERDIVFYRESISKLDYQRDIMFNDAEEIERYAREKYYMKRPNEDVFIVEDSE